MAMRISYKLYHESSEQQIFGKWLSDLNTGLPPGKQLNADDAAKKALFWAINESYKKVEELDAQVSTIQTPSGQELGDEKRSEIQSAADVQASGTSEVPSDQRTEEA